MDDREHLLYLAIPLNKRDREQTIYMRGPVKFPGTTTYAGI